MKIGMNLPSPVYWSDDFPFIDRMKCSGDWNPAKTVLAVDANGWPTKINGKATCYLPMTAVPTSFVIRWKGKGKFNLGRNFNPTSSGKDWLKVKTAAFPGNEKSSNSLNILEIDPDNPLRNISVVEARYDSLHLRGETLNPDHIERLRGYYQIRFMDWMRTNGSTVSTVADLPTMTQRSWSRGVPLAVCLSLVAKLGARAWINIPHMADDALITFIAKQCPASTDIEFSNEMWNTAFPQGKLALTQATAGKIDKSTWIARVQMHAARLVALMGHKLVVGYQPTTNPNGWDSYCAALIKAGAAATNVSHTMTTIYPTGNLNSITAITPFMQTNDRSGVIARLLQDVEENSGARFAVAKSLGDRLGVPWSIYEGNVAHLNTSRSSDACVPFVEAVQRDPAIRQVGNRILAIAEEKGCDVLNVFSLSGPATKAGFFGVTGTPFGDLIEEIRRQRWHR